MSTKAADDSAAPNSRPPYPQVVATILIPIAVIGLLVGLICLWAHYRTQISAFTTKHKPRRKHASTLGIKPSNAVERIALRNMAKVRAKEKPPGVGLQFPDLVVVKPRSSRPPPVPVPANPFADDDDGMVDVELGNWRPPHIVSPSTSVESPSPESSPRQRQRQRPRGQSMTSENRAIQNMVDMISDKR